MALDGLFLYALKDELKHCLVGLRVEKISQPAKHALVISFRGKSGAYRVLFSASGNAAGVYITDYKPENPAVPPMFTMLMRKNLVGAILKDIRQNRTDRILFFDFDATNEIGDHVGRTMIVEVMAQYSNLILTDENGKIIDSIKRVDLLHSSVRQILPGLQYELPPQQGKLSLLYDDLPAITAAIDEQSQLRLDKAITAAAEGVSPALARELAYRIECSDGGNATEPILQDVRQSLLDERYDPCAVYDADGKPIDFSFLPLTQYTGRDVKNYETLSSLLDDYFYNTERNARVKSKAEDLKKLIATATERITKKLSGQQAELAAAADRDKKRVYGDLINANLYRLEKGSLYYDLENFYDGMQPVRIPADPRLTPAANAQKYYKEYRKAATAEKILTEQIKKGNDDLHYILSVKDIFERAETEKEFAAIREELAATGFIKSANKSSKKAKPAALPFTEYTSPNGFKVTAGKNNLQNDKLSFKIATKKDLWFHVQKFHGSHVILTTDGREPQPEDYVFAAKIAVANSEVKDAERIPVDYTAVKNLIKPNGAKPGFVIYHVYKTIIV